MRRHQPEGGAMAVFENRATNPITNEPIVIFGHLSDFAIGSATLLKDHRDWLTTVAAPFLNGNDQATFVLHGFASRSGAADRNQRLSEKRLVRVFEFLTSAPRSVRPSKNAFNEAVGELAGALAGQADGTEDSLLRAVTVELWSIDVRGLTAGVRKLKRQQAGMFIF